jgi:hypothetical protein
VKNYGYIFILLLLAGFVMAQDPKERKKLRKEADAAYRKDDFLHALTVYTQLLKSDSGNSEMIYRSGRCIFGINKTDSSSIPFFQRVQEKYPDAKYYSGIVYHLKNNPRKALENFVSFKEINDEREVSATELREWISRSEQAILQEGERDYFLLQNCGSRINTRFAEYVPLIRKSDGSMFFTSRRPGSTAEKLDPYGRYYEDIYVAKRDMTWWLEPEKIDGKLNTPTHDACVAFSPGDKELIIYRTSDDQLSGDLYITKSTPDGWSDPEKLPAEINSEFLEASACFSPDGDEIIFSSNRPEGFGGKDLYRCSRFMNGKYSMPQNLGPAINTEEDEDAPYIDLDHTLYFSSKGHKGMGEYDIFRATYQNEMNAWSSVMNLGQPVNSTADDIYFTRSPEYDLAYFTSRRAGGYGEADIYEVHFNKSTRIIAYYRITLPPGATPEDAQLKLIDPLTGATEGLYTVRAGNPVGIMLATKGKQYELQVEGDRLESEKMLVSFDDQHREQVIILKKKPE